MALSCGCEIVVGMAIDQYQLAAHYKHTLEVMLFWEMMHSVPPPEDNIDSSIKLSQARIDYVEALEARFPQLKGI